jgi:zinc finger protein
MLTKIPFYRDVIISSFRCDHCHYNNNGIESANKIQEHGVKIKLTVNNVSDMNRELVKSDYATLRIPEIDFEIPPTNQKGCLTTVEGVIDRVIFNIQSDIDLRKVYK